MSDRGQRPRIVFFGMRCAFSEPPLAALLAAGCDVLALVLPGTPGSSPTSVPPAFSSGPGIVALASAARVPILEIGDLHRPTTLSAIAEYRPDLFAVVCFPWRFPAALRAIAPLGCLNVHPSL